LEVRDLPFPPLQDSSLLTRHPSPKQAASKKPLAPWATSWETAWTCAAGSRRNPTKLARGSRRWAGVSFSVFFSVSTSAYFEITLARNSMVLKRFELAFDMTFTDYYQQARERLSPALRSMPMIRLLTRRLERRIIWIWGLGSRLDFLMFFRCSLLEMMNL
jgi:hypothetical protein